MLKMYDWEGNDVEGNWRDTWGGWDGESAAKSSVGCFDVTAEATGATNSGNQNTFTCHNSPLSDAASSPSAVIPAIAEISLIPSRNSFTTS